MKKTIFALALAISMLTACGGSSKSANPETATQSNTTSAVTTEASKTFTPIKDFKYEVVDGNLILKKYNGRDKVVCIANEYEIEGSTYPVLSVDGGMFFTRSVKTAVFSEGITDITHAVFNSSKIERLYLPSSLSCIYDDSLAYISRSLTDIYYGGSEDQWNQIYTAYKTDSVSSKIDDNDFEGAGAAVADKLNSLIGHDFDLSSVTMHYNATEADMKQ